MKTLIIAEAGVNHNGDMGQARELVEIAAEAGADLIKFQTFSADRLATVDARQSAYQARNTGLAESQHAMLRRLELSKEMHEALIAHCESCSIGFFSTGFDEQSVDMLVEFGLDLIKVPSGEITNLPYLRHVGGFGKKVLLSTGMATLPETSAALDVLQRAGTPRDLVTILHCTTDYPTPIPDVNLRAMLTLQSEFGTNVGYSDHTIGVEVSIAAVALGATVVEKHFTLDRGLPGPDHKASLEPDELRNMIAAIRNIEEALGDGVKRVTAGEARNRPAARKSIVAARAISAGEMFSDQNLVAKRPGTGLSPMQWEDVIGQKAPRDFAPDELIEL